MRCCAATLRAGLAMLFLGVGIGGLFVSTSIAADPEVVRVEEDWELVVATPDTNTNGPQITTVIAPTTAGIAGLHAALNINHRSLPQYVAGGLQLQAWNGRQSLSEKQFPSSTLMATADEVVSWTQSIETAGGAVTFEVTRGSSTTWGTFGGQGYLKIVLVWPLTNLNSYSPSVSAAHSGVGFASNRVRSLVLKRVRLFTSTGQQLDDATPRVVYQQE